MVCTRVTTGPCMGNVRAMSQQTRADETTAPRWRLIGPGLVVAATLAFAAFAINEIRKAIALI